MGELPRLKMQSESRERTGLFDEAPNLAAHGTICSTKSWVEWRPLFVVRERTDLQGMTLQHPLALPEGITMPMSPSRRRFIEITPFAGIALLAACSPKSEPSAPATTTTAPEPVVATAPTPPAANAPSEKLPMLSEQDGQAVALGYVEDATRADKARFKNFVLGSECSNCALYQGKAEENSGPCPLFPGKNVAAKGWCTSWAKKA